MKGMILHESDTIVSIATFKSNNDKTGDMVQVWIMLKDINPVEALKTGQDKAICFDCPHRGGSCYVNVGQAPLAVWKAYKKGNYERLDLTKLKNAVKWKAVRFGAYGEPVLLPLGLVALITKHARAYTGYTHQWHKPEYQDYKQYFMASCESAYEVLNAHYTGWRSFRVAKTEEADIMDTSTEITCPNLTHGVQCRDCTLCDGAGVGKSIVVPVHGTKAKINAFNLKTI